jgi:polyferredoxin/Pyruvate/2-oxoacid:ferredoxin oxidoreductase delta subunit
MARSRRILQILFLLFFMFLFIRARYPYDVDLSSDIFLRFSPLLPLFYFIDSLTLPLFLLPALIILILTLFLGRFFCGWICPLGTSIDIFDRIAGAPSNKISRRWVKFRWVKFGLLSISIILALFSINIWGYFDPIAIFTRLTTVIFYPFMTLMVEKLIIAGFKISFLESVVTSIYDWYKSVIMPESQASHYGVLWILLLVIFIFALEKLSKRFWCRYICPAGALLGFFSQFRFYERIVSNACPVCNRCQVECKMNAIPEGNVKETHKVECIECFNCSEKCPPKAKSISYRFRWSPYHSKPDFSRRQFLGATVTGIATLSLFGIQINSKNAAAKIIRPPGAIPEEDFMDKCTRCLECVRICASNGRCLQPAGFDQNILHLWTPIAIMREGYCEYNCNLCGQVCPTDAILPLPVEVKQKTSMGLAHFDKNLCIPFERHEDCIVCEEHCPTPDKAIKFEIKEVVLPDGKQKMVKYPYVVRDLCIGCGICEEKCPLPNLPGIFVTKENEQRLKKIPRYPA